MKENIMTKETITSRNAMTLRAFAILGALSLAVMLAACSSSNNNTHTTTTPPTVSLSTFPTSLFVNDTASITATVTNDSTNAGVTWSCAPSGSCGTFSAATSASGTPVTYTAPATVPSGTVTITATSKADTSVTANTSAVTINPASGITVSLSTPPPGSMVVNGTASIAATVTGDSANGGVSWSCAPAGSCGSFSANTSASTTPVTYTAPASAGTVTITATSVTDDAQMANATVTVTSTVATLAAGNYVFFVSGWDLIGNSVSTDANGNYTYAGAFAVDSTGTITGGEQDYADDYYVSPVAEGITGGSVAATSDGNLLITIKSGDTTIGNGTGTIVLDASLVSTSKALLTEYDTWASGSGELDLQSTTLAAPTGGFAFYMTGLDINALPISLGGVINVDGANAISGSGSVIDINDAGTLYPTQTLAANTSTVDSPDTFGHVLFLVNADCTQPTTDPQLCGSGGYSLVTEGYMVDNNHIRLVEDWYTDYLSAGVGGTAVAQGSNTGTFPTTVSGSYVVGLNGRDSSTYSFLQTAGVLTFGTTMSGNWSFNDFDAQSPQGGVAITAGTYTADATGRVIVTGATDGATFSTNLNLYLTGDSAGDAVVISMDGNDAVSGLGWLQTTSTLNAASLTGAYGLDLTQSTNGLEQDAVGAFNSNGSNALTGFYDVNGSVSVDALAPDQTFHSSYAATSANGVFSVTGGGAAGQLFTAYLIDGTHGVVIENDNSLLSLGYFEQQQ